MPRGGHNPLEPAAFGLPTITGPHIFKNTAEFAGLREHGVIFDLIDDGDDPTSTGQAVANMAVAIMQDKARYKLIASAAKRYAVNANKRTEDAAKIILAITEAPKNI